MLNPALRPHQAFSNTGLQARDPNWQWAEAALTVYVYMLIVTGLKAGVNQKHEEACPSFIRFR